MRRNRICYWGSVIAFAVLLFFFSKPYLLCVCIILIVLAVLTRILLKHDTEKISVSFHADSHGSESAHETMWIEIRTEHKLLSAGTVRMDLEIHNKMFGLTEERHLLLPLSERSHDYQIPDFIPLCGEMQVRCKQLRVRDVCNLFDIRMKRCPEESVIVYPRKVNVQLQLSYKAAGTRLSEGFIQNQKGKDPSEMYDIRDYVPGDDIRSIHWKLSGKTDSLVLRQASDTSHYRVAVLADFHRTERNEKGRIEECNLAVSVGIAMCEQLLAKGMAFCMAVPTDSGLYFYEINNEREFYRMMPYWMSIEVPQKEGTGLEYFKNQHMEQYFTRLLILSAGRYQAGLAEIQNYIGITVIHTNEKAERMMVSENGSVVMVEIPTNQERQENYQINC